MWQDGLFVAECTWYQVMLPAAAWMRAEEEAAEEAAEEEAAEEEAVRHNRHQP